MERRKHIQLNNKGFSLVEVLIAMVIFAVAVIPITLSLIRGVQANMTADRIQDETSIAETVLESCKAYGAEGLANKFSKNFTNPAGFSIECDDLDFVNASEKTYDIKVEVKPSSKMQVSTFPTPEPSAMPTPIPIDIFEVETMNAYNDAVYCEPSETEIAGGGAPILKVPDDVDSAISDIVLQKCESFFDHTDNMSYSIRRGSLNCVIDSTGGATKVDVTREYVYSFKCNGWIINPVTNIADVNINHPDNDVTYTYSYVTTIYDNTNTKGKKDAENNPIDVKLENVYLFFYPNYGENEERITVTYKGASNTVNVFLIKQYLNDFVTKGAEENKHKYAIVLDDLSSKMNFYHNLNKNIARSGPMTTVGAYTIQDIYGANIKSTSMQLENADVMNKDNYLLFDIKVSVFNAGEGYDDDNALYTIAGTLN